MSASKTPLELKQIIEKLNTRPNFTTPIAFGVGILARSRSGRSLEVYYPLLGYNNQPELTAILIHLTNFRGGNGVYPLSSELLEEGASILASSGLAKLEKAIEILRKLASTDEPIVTVFITEDIAPASVEEAYLKLSIISHQLVKPRTLNIDGIFDILPNVAWTSEGPIEVEEVPERILNARLEGRRLEIYSVDKFPKLLNHLVPQLVRVVDGSRVRLGAYLGAGTTVMQGGLVNFNAGTAGPNMVEGRISAGVFVDSGTDLGGGSSIMGSVYRETSTAISIGKDCVIGANAGAGISLGDQCTVESGLYVTAGTKVNLLDRTGARIGTVKARDLSGKSNLLFRRNSTSGQVEALESTPTVQLNKAMHTNR